MVALPLWRTGEAKHPQHQSPFHFHLFLHSSTTTSFLLACSVILVYIRRWCHWISYTEQRLVSRSTVLKPFHWSLPHCVLHGIHSFTLYLSLFLVCSLPASKPSHICHICGWSKVRLQWAGWLAAMLLPPAPDRGCGTFCGRFKMNPPSCDLYPQ